MGGCVAETVDVLVLGAGAAGLMAAIEAGRRGRRVLVVDHADRAGKKILISGGGRCNFTNLGCQAEHFLSANPHFAKSALARFTPEDMVAMVERHQIAYHEKAPGQLFCDRSAVEVVRMLERECRDVHVELRLGARVDAVSPGFRVSCDGKEIRADSVVVATGGLSIPKMGASGLGYDLARQFGHDVLPCRPGLVPLTFSVADSGRWSDLAGLSAEVLVRTEGRPGTSFREKMLVTHRGLSGPAILQVSSYWREGGELTVDLAPGVAVFPGLLQRNTRRDLGAVTQSVRAVLPTRFADRWIAVQQPTDWTNAGIAHLEEAMHGWRVRPEGTEGYAKAEVTVGGVDTAGLDARTMESRLVKGLYFVGEVVDVTGWLGGYNFQWAWASGASAGRAA